MRSLCRIGRMGKAGRYKRVRHRRAVRLTKRPCDEKVFSGITPEEFFSEIEQAATTAGVSPRVGFMP
jgi:hypothetical protein